MFFPPSSVYKPRYPSELRANLYEGVMYVIIYLLHGRYKKTERALYYISQYHCEVGYFL